MSNDYIIVNATALDSSGALNILKQFIANTPTWGQWLIFVSNKVDITEYNGNIRIEHIARVKSVCKRLWWDLMGLNHWLKCHQINPVACISLQNTGFRVTPRHIPFFIYYHQSIPFYDFKWNPFKREQRVLWLYKNIYPIFIKLFLKKDTHIFVQLNYIKEGFKKRFHHNESLISVFSPTILAPNPNNNSVNVHLDAGQLNLFYPATYFFYKNHYLLQTAVKSIVRPMRLFCTIDQGVIQDNKIECVGKLTYSAVVSMYQQCDLLVYPSFIETFGLPLLEAAMAGMPIIAADLPYAHEVLAGYEGVLYLPFNDPTAWAKAIENAQKGVRYTPLQINQRPSWEELFQYIHKFTT